MSAKGNNKLAEIVKSQKDLAFIVGNGINRYGVKRGGDSKEDERSWKTLIKSLWSTFGTPPSDDIVYEDVHLTEIYDLLSLYDNSDIEMRGFVSEKLATWKPEEQHHRLVERLMQLDAPILTTNFDATLTSELKKMHLRISQSGSPFSHHYPWTTYFGSKVLSTPLDGFGIWHINGMIGYPYSIRLALSHYMGAVQRARQLLHHGDSALFASARNTKDTWAGSNTWLEIFFRKRLVIMGLGLESNETFLRWLLVERAKYLRSLECDWAGTSGWYLHTKRDRKGDKVKPVSPGKRLFMEAVGIKVLELETAKHLYECRW